MYFINNVQQINGFFFKLFHSKSVQKKCSYVFDWCMFGNLLVKKFVAYWFFECKSICYPQTWSRPYHGNCPALEQLQRKDLTTHKVPKLLKRSGNLCKYTAEYRFNCKTTHLNRTASAVTHFQGKFTSIQIREPAATEAVIGAILWKKLSLKNCSIFTGKQLCRSLFLISLQAWRPATFLKKDFSTGIMLWILSNF